MSTAKAELAVNNNNSNYISSMLNTSMNSSNEPFKLKELEEKKRKLNLPLSIQNPSSSSTVLQSIESSNGVGSGKDTNDNNLSNKKQKTMYNLLNLPTIQTTTEQVTTPTYNKDILDLNNNLTTPQIERLLADINTSGTLRTPGSALAILTPMNANGTTPVFTLPFLPQISIEDSNSQSNLIQLTNTNNMLNVANTNTFNNVNMINDPAVTPTAATLINPSTIFYSNSITSFTNSATPSYEILTDVSKLNGKSGTFLVEQTSNNLNNNGMSNGTSAVSNGSVSSEFNIKLENIVKDEFQTVPILKNVNTTNIQSMSERVEDSGNNQLQKRRINSKIKKENKNEPASNEVSNSIQIRRDTESSSSSYTNLDDPEQARLEKKRERNREAARKCRTRKLEKIATLETQVDDLMRQNQAERDKTKKLRDEIEILKKKIEEHQKIYNCDIKFTK
jgi:hypothetical protein